MLLLAPQFLVCITPLQTYAGFLKPSTSVAVVGITLGRCAEQLGPWLWGGQRQPEPHGMVWAGLCEETDPVSHCGGLILSLSPLSFQKAVRVTTLMQNGSGPPEQSARLQPSTQAQILPPLGLQAGPWRKCSCLSLLRAVPPQPQQVMLQRARARGPRRP